MPDDYIVVTELSRRDPDGSKLRRMLQAQAAMERARLYRARMVHLLAWVSAPLALVAARAGVAPGLRALAVAAWVTVAGGLVDCGGMRLVVWSQARVVDGDLESPPRRAR